MKIALALDNCHKMQKNNIIGLSYQVSPYVDVIKIGLELFIRFGPSANVFAGGSELFLDLKIVDIPNTIGNAVKEANKLKVKYLTIYGCVDEKTLHAAASYSKNIRLLAITRLTSSSEINKPHMGEVLKTIERCTKVGITGFVAPVSSVAEIKRQFPGVFVATPGIRFKRLKGDDQRETATPDEAYDAGSDMLIIGRPVTQSRNPVKILQKLQKYRSK